MAPQWHIDYEYPVMQGAARVIEAETEEEAIQKLTDDLDEAYDNYDILGANQILEAKG